MADEHRLTPSQRAENERITRQLADTVARVNLGLDLLRQGKAVVGLDGGQMVEFRPDGTTRTLDESESQAGSPERLSEGVTHTDPSSRWRQAFCGLCDGLLKTGSFNLETLRVLREDPDQRATLEWVAAQGLSLIVAETDSGSVYPSFQFTSTGDVRPELAEHIVTLRQAGLSPWLTWDWLTKPAALLSGQTAEQVLRTSTRRGALAVQRYAARVREAKGSGAIYRSDA